MRRLVLSKDIAINRLTQDRDALKVKLTLINNQNIELSQRFKRIDAQNQEFLKSYENSDQMIELKAKCNQLEAINSHLRQHLSTLRNVFNELHNSGESNANQTTTTTSTSTGNTSDVSNTLVNENTTDSNITSNTTNNTTNSLIIAKNNESSAQTSNSSFDNWYDK